MPDDPPEEAASEPGGTMARRKPIRSASATRRGTPGDAAHLAGQADLADRDHGPAARLRFADRAGQRERDGQVHRRLGQPDAADGRRVHVLLADR